MEGNSSKTCRAVTDYSLIDIVVKSTLRHGLKVSIVVCGPRLRTQSSKCSIKVIEDSFEGNCVDNSLGHSSFINVELADIVLSCSVISGWDQDAVRASAECSCVVEVVVVEVSTYDSKVFSSGSDDSVG